MPDHQISQTDLGGHLQALVDAAPRTILVIDAEGTIRWISRASELLVGQSPEQVVGHSMTEYIHEDDLPLLVDSLAFILAHPGTARPMEYRYYRADGTTGVLEVTSTNHLDDPTIQGIVAQVHDVTSRRMFDLALESIASGAPLADILRLIARQVEEQVGEARVIVGVDPDGDSFRLAASTLDIVDEEPSVEATSAETPPTADDAADEADDPSADVLVPETPWGRAIRTGLPVIDPDLGTLPDWLAAESKDQGFASCWAFPTGITTGGDVSGCIIVWRTVPGQPSPGMRVGIERAGRLLALALERRRTESLLLHAARHDTLTGLPNRTQFFQRLERELGRDEHLMGVLYLDLDGFKSINDRYGHRAGDEVLTTVALRIEAALRPDDLTARLGGDEFGVICARLHDESEAIAIAERLIESLAQPMTLPADSIRSADMALIAGAPIVDLPPGHGPVEVSVQVSIGIAFAPQAGSDHEHLVELADAAMYQAKRAGSGCWCLAGAQPPSVPTEF